MGVCPLLLGLRVGACVYALTVCGGKCLHLLCVSVGVCLTHCCMYVFAYVRAHVCACVVTWHWHSEHFLAFVPSICLRVW